MDIDPSSILTNRGLNGFGLMGGGGGITGGLGREFANDGSNAVRINAS
jgi:hypothetical protein